MQHFPYPQTKFGSLVVGMTTMLPIQCKLFAFRSLVGAIACNMGRLNPFQDLLKCIGSPISLPLLFKGCCMSSSLSPSPWLLVGLLVWPCMSSSISSMPWLLVGTIHQIRSLCDVKSTWSFSRGGHLSTQENKIIFFKNWSIAWSMFVGCKIGFS